MTWSLQPVCADGITSDGFLLNKTGTCALAMCCAALGKPLYVLAHSFKFTPVNHTDIPIVQHSLQEILDKPRADDGFTVRNLYFDWTPCITSPASSPKRALLLPRPEQQRQRRRKVGPKSVGTRLGFVPVGVGTCLVRRRAAAGQRGRQASRPSLGKNPAPG